MDRRLAAILAADVVGYSRLMGEDEETTLKTLKTHREEVFAPKIAEHHGRIVDFTGDAALAEFASVVDAVECAVAIQTELNQNSANVSEELRIAWRIGINLGDVIVESDSIYGDGVNVAARLESLAEPGGICVSRSVYNQVRDKLSVAFEDIGEQRVKNISRPLHAFAVVLDGQAHRRARRPSGALGRYWGYGLVGLALAALIGVAGLMLAQDGLKHDVGSTPTIAVLPFANQGGSASDEYFSDGLTEDIIGVLSRFPNLMVMSRNAVFPYKGKQITAAEIGKQLGVAYLVGGSVRKSENQIRVQAQLSDARDGVVLWSARYDEDIKSIFAVQDKITNQVIGTLVGRLNLVEQKRVFAEPTDNLKAYDLVLRGRAMIQPGTRAANFKAREEFTIASKLDPNFAWAFAWLGRTHLNDAVFGWVERPNRSLRRSFELVQKAIKLDDGSEMAHALLAEIYTYRQRYDLAEAEANRVLKLNPSHPDGHAIRGSILLHKGKPKDAITSFETARRFNPQIGIEWFNLLAISYYLANRPNDAIKLLEGLTIRYPEFPYFFVVLAAVYAELGNTQAASDAAEKVRQLAPFFDSAGFAQQYLGKTQMERFVAAARKAGLR